MNGMDGAEALRFPGEIEQIASGVTVAYRSPMLAAWLIHDLIVTAIALLWAKRAKLDLGLRPPVSGDAWPWILLYIVWFATEWVIFTFYPSEDGPDILEELRQLTLPGALVLMCVTDPVFEQVLFRGAMFSALLRRWGIWTAAIVPSILWGVIHIGYEAWFVASITGSGVVLAIIRWKSGSLYVPLALHATGNLLVTLDNYAELAV